MKALSISINWHSPTNQVFRASTRVCGMPLLPRKPQSSYTRVSGYIKYIIFSIFQMYKMYIYSSIRIIFDDYSFFRNTLCFNKNQFDDRSIWHFVLESILLVECLGIHSMHYFGYSRSCTYFISHYQNICYILKNYI